MNKVNGYCQIELPDRLNFNALKSTGATLTKEEARPIIDKLGLGGIKLPETTEERNTDAIHKQVKDALIRKPAYIVTKKTLVDGISIVPATIMDNIDCADNIDIRAFAERLGDPVAISITIDLTSILDAETIPTIYDLEIAIYAWKITKTQIS